MSVREFVDAGYLQELNRRFLHPLGMSLEVIEEPDGALRFGKVWDYREDAAGVVFAEFSEADREKARKIFAMEWSRIAPRRGKCGFWIQPIESPEDGCSTPSKTTALSSQEKKTSEHASPV